MSNTDSEHTVIKSIVVAQSIDVTFRIWTEQIHAWWPTGHSLSGDPQTRVCIEGQRGGRFYERTSDGVEYEWGSIVVWEPPHHIIFTWYLGSNQELPTKVEVRFTALDDSQTRIDLEHRGPELIGELWWQRQAIFHASWDTILARFTAFLTSQTDATP